MIKTLLQLITIKASQQANKRLTKELKNIENNIADSIRAWVLDESNILKWGAMIKGPADTPYENGFFELQMDFPQNYPFKPPVVKFITPVYHCNVSNGSICLDILKEDMWSSAYSIEKILLSIMILLSQPVPSGFNGDAVATYKKNKEDYNKIAKEWTVKYANDSKNKFV